MPPVITVFRSSPFRPTEVDQFEAFVVTRLNPAVSDVALSVARHGYMERESGRTISDQKAHRRLWAMRGNLPIRVVPGRRKGTVMLASSGDSDNGDDSYVDDAAVRDIAAFIPDETLVGFERIQFPSNDSDDLGGVWYWVCRGRTVAARLGRDWSAPELATSKYRLPSLSRIMQVFRRSGEFGLAAHDRESDTST